MNETTRQLKERKSIRAFENKIISPEIKKEILQCAMEAPSGGNQQQYTILDITEQQKERTKPVRCDISDMVMENRYQKKDGEQLRKMFRGKYGKADGASFESWAQAFCRRKYNSAFSREMTRSVEKYLEAFR